MLLINNGCKIKVSATNPATSPICQPILGIIGGIIGLANQSYEDITWVTLLGSILGLISALMIKSDPKHWGKIMRTVSFVMFINFFSWPFEFNFDLLTFVVIILFFLGGGIAIGSHVDEEQNISAEENNATDAKI